jgi:RNA polymerase sigma-70 factor, ECF subfamily
VDLEAAIQQLRLEGDLRGAATLAVEGFGPELYGFLVTLLCNDRDAGEAFSQTCEDMWTGLDRFEGRCSMRTWLYKLARHAAARLRRSPHHRAGRHVALSQVSDLAERVRTRTLSLLRTEKKDRLASIRDSLHEDDRALLVLRIDRGLSWSEIAYTFSTDDHSEETLRRVAARLRKRFQLLKEEIRTRIRDAGLSRGHDS